MAEGRPHIVDMIKNGEMDLIINTVEDKRSAIHDSYSIRHAVLQARVTYYTTLAGARAACIGMASMQELQADSLRTLHGLPHAASFEPIREADPFGGRETDTANLAK